MAQTRISLLELNLMLICLLLFVLSNSKIIFQQSDDPFISDHNLKDAQKLQADANKDIKNNDNLRNKIEDQRKTIQTNNYIADQSIKPQDHYVQIVTPEQTWNSNFNLIQRSKASLQPNFTDEESVYTSKLSLQSSFGSQIDSKVMEYVKRKIQSNRKMILEHNTLKRHSYKLAQNKFIVYTSEEFKQIFLTLQQPDSSDINNQTNNVIVEAPQMNLRKLQETHIDWKQAKKMTSVKYQKQCGACYSFTTIGAIESAYLIQGQNLNLAQQQIIDCSTSFNNQGCIGGWTIHAYKYIKDFGVLFESDYPYTATFGNCAVTEGKTRYRIKNYVELSDDCNVVIQALRNQPLSIAINADGWQHYSSGIYTDCRQGQSNHGVVLAGVDSTSWLIKNSWGFTWGQQGYIKVSRTAPNEACNVCRWASYPVL